MPRPRYTITEDDYQHAYSYLAPKLRDFSLDLRSSSSLVTAEKNFRKAAEQTTAAKKASALNDWCQKYLPTAEWTRLKAGIRKRRERWEHHGEQKTLTVSSVVHDYLVKLSERDSVTHNEILEDVLSRAWRGSRKISGGRTDRKPPRKE